MTTKKGKSLAIMREIKRCTVIVPKNKNRDAW